MINDLIDMQIDNIKDADFDIVTPEIVEKGTVTVDMKQVLADYKTSRENIMLVIDNARASIEALTALSDQSQEPRMYEVLGKHNQVLLEANRDLVDLNTKIKNLVTFIEQVNNTTNVENKTNIFVGSTAELSKLVAMMKKSGEL